MGNSNVLKFERCEQLQEKRLKQSKIKLVGNTSGRNGTKQQNYVYIVGEKHLRVM